MLQISFLPSAQLMFDHSDTAQLAHYLIHGSHSAFPFQSKTVSSVITLVCSRDFTIHFRGVVVFLFLFFFSNSFTDLGVLGATCPAVLHSELICSKCQLCACCLAHAVSSHLSLVPLQCSEWFPFFYFPFLRFSSYLS